MVLKCKGSSLLCGYLPLLRCIFGNGICPFLVVLWTPLFVFRHEFISKIMALNYILNYFVMLHTLYIYIYIHQRYLWTCEIECNYPIKWRFQHSVLLESQSSYMLYQLYQLYQLCRWYFRNNAYFVIASVISIIFYIQILYLWKIGGQETLHL